VGDGVDGGGGGAPVDGFEVALDTDQLNIAQTTWTNVDFDVVNIDEFGSSFSTATDKFTVPKTGWYVFQYQIYVQGQDAKNMTYGLSINDTAPAIEDGSMWDAPTKDRFSGAFLKKLTLNDTIELQIYTTEAGTLDITEAVFRGIIVEYGGVFEREVVVPAAAMRGGMDPGDSFPAPTHVEWANIDGDVAAFDDDVDECTGFQTSIPDALTIDGTDTITFLVDWMSTTATTGNVMWYVMHLPVAEGESPNQSFTTEPAAVDAVQGTVTQSTFTSWTETVTASGVAANDTWWLLLCRDANHASDTMVGDAAVNLAKIRVPRE
jgi:hypothetical protein